MHKYYQDCIKDLDRVDTYSYSRSLIKILATLSHCIDECVTPMKSQEITDMFKRMLEGVDSGIPKNK